MERNDGMADTEALILVVNGEYIEQFLIKAELMRVPLKLSIALVWIGEK